MDNLKVFIYKFQGWLVSIGWVMLLSLFTYTELFHSLLRTDEKFADVYQECQAHLLSLVVNIGLLVMLVFDYMSAGREFSNRKVIAIMSAILFPVLLYAMATLQKSEDIVHYVDFMKSPNLLYVLHLIFLWILTWLKKESMGGDVVGIQMIRKEFT